MNDKRSPYKNYRQAMMTAIDPDALNRWRLIAIRGESDFLMIETCRHLKRIWEQAAWSVERLEGNQLNAERFLEATSARSLFEPKTITLVHDAAQASDLLNHLQSIKSSKDLQNPLVLLWKGRDFTGKVLKEIERIGVLQIPCDEPAPWELKDFVQDRSRHYKLPLTSDAVELLLEAIGPDLFKLDNEINRLHLSFEQSSNPRNAAAIRPLLEFLREDHVFKLDQLLCTGAIGKALLLLKDLLDRGEKPLALLAIVAMHCRKALQVQAGLKNGSSAYDLARQLRLPPSVVQSYIPYVQKRSTNTFQRALRLCHEADRRLKSRSEGEELWLSQIFFELSGKA